MKIKMAQGCEDLLPTRATEGSSGFDLRASEDIIIGPYCYTLIPTGIFLELPLGFEGQVRPRSGLSSQGKIIVFGTIDSDYRGEIKAIATTSSFGWKIHRGDKIAQLVIAPVYMGELTLVTEMSYTERGNGGFGSTDENI